MATTDAEQQRKPITGAANPYALAEVKLGRKVDWAKEKEPHALLEKAFGIPVKKLFDHTSGSPLFISQEQIRLHLKGEKVTVGAMPIAVGGGIDTGSSMVWADPGTFFGEAAEFFDPVQGGVGDCYLIAALASVAWARPYVIAQRTRATGGAQQQFVNMIQFYDGANPVQVEVTENLPLTNPGNLYIYCRSREAGEIWPAVYEKAYAKWRTGSGDQPNIPAIAGGDPVGAAAQITGLTPTYYWNDSLSEDDIYQRVRENSLSRRTFNPMVAFTFCSSPPPVDYAGTGIVGCHAYSILGWDYRNNQKYIVLRNPWGFQEASINVDGGDWMAYDNSFWRTVPLADNDGTFALRADTFKKYYWGFGVVK